MTKIFIAGHNGMVGSAIYRQLKNNNENEILVASRNDVNLQCQDSVNSFIKSNTIDQIYLAAAKVGGIHANNTYPAEFIYENLMIQNNIINSAYNHGIKKLLFLGSSCIYPKLASQPIKEEELLNGPLESTNEPYAIAKIAGIKMCQSYNRQYDTDYRCIMPTNLYGPGDNFHKKNSHVIPALIRRFDEAKNNNEKEVVVWGTGNARREFLHVDDMANASIFIMNQDLLTLKSKMREKVSHINIGTGIDVKISFLAKLIAECIGFSGSIKFDSNMPDGTPRKQLDISMLNEIGWQYKTELMEGILSTYSWYKANIERIRS
ncbi:GDP-L-fucose synthase [Gammaproteobacteria bacterium]|nr:GDP-L-fucose synthase [Gammaproteobacteria bacterium]